MARGKNTFLTKVVFNRFRQYRKVELELNNLTLLDGNIKSTEGN
jgi:hypothetical protein